MTAHWTERIFPASCQVGWGSEAVPDLAGRQRDSEAKDGWPREDDRYSEVADGEQLTDDSPAQPHHRQPSPAEQAPQRAAKPAQAGDSAAHGQKLVTEILCPCPHPTSITANLQLCLSFSIPCRMLIRLSQTDTSQTWLLQSGRGRGYEPQWLNTVSASKRKGWRNSSSQPSWSSSTHSYSPSRVSSALLTVPHRTLVSFIV